MILQSCKNPQGFYFRFDSKRTMWSYLPWAACPQRTNYTCQKRNYRGMSYSAFHSYLLKRMEALAKGWILFKQNNKSKQFLLWLEVIASHSLKLINNAVSLLGMSHSCAFYGKRSCGNFDCFWPEALGYH